MKRLILITLIFMTSCQNSAPLLNDKIQDRLKQFYSMALDDPDSYQPLSVSEISLCNEDKDGWSSGNITHTFLASNLSGERDTFTRAFTVLVHREGEIFLLPEQYD